MEAMTRKKHVLPGPVPAKCCGRDIEPAAVAARRKMGKSTLTCPVCGRCWSIEQGQQGELSAKPKTPLQETIDQANASKPVAKTKKANHPLHPTPQEMNKPAPARPEKPSPGVVGQINENVRTAGKLSGAQTLGYTVWWSLEGVEVPSEDFATLCEQLGLDTDLLSERKKGGALSQALQALKSGFMVARCSDECNEDEIVYALTEKRSDSQLIRHDQQKVTYDRSKKQLTDFATDFRVQDIKDLFAKYNVTLRSIQVSAYITKVLHSVQATRLRESGGVYFVPEKGRATKDKLAQLLGKLAAHGQRSRLTSIDVLDTPTSGAQLRQDVGDGLLAELSTFSSKLEREIFGPAEDGRQSKPETLQAHLDEFKAIRAKARNYRDLMQVNTDELETGVKELEQRIKDLAGRA